MVTELGGDPAAYLRRFDIPPSALESGDALISITAHDLMVDTAARELCCPDLGLRMANIQDLSILGPLAIAIEASDTVAAALDCVSKFMFVHSPALRVSVEPDPRGRREVVALTYHKDLRESPYSPQAMEQGLGVFHRVALALVGGEIGLRSVEFPHQPLSPLRVYTEFFGADVQFGCAQGSLRVERSLLDRPFGSADAAIRRVALDYLTSHHADPEDRLATQVRRALAESLGTTEPSIGHVARLFAVHPRTLQRRLAAESTTFDQILDEVRCDLAVRHILTTDLPFGQVAAMVGFADASTLSHAVRRWRGLSPRELRHRGGIA